MAKLFGLSVPVLACLLLLGLGQSHVAAAPASDPCEIIVQFTAGTSRTAMTDTAGEMNVMVERAAPGRSRAGVPFAVYASQTQALEELIERFQNLPGVIAVSPNYSRSFDRWPNDPRIGEQWGLKNTGDTGGIAGADIGAFSAWSITQGSGVVLVSIDTGVDYTHPDLSANMWHNPGETPGDGVDNDGNGYIDDVYGIDPLGDDSDPMDENGHGTHTAGTMAAVGDNGIGVAGVAWKAKIMALRFLGSDGRGSDSDAIACINYAIDMKLNHNVNIAAINASWGGGANDPVLLNAIRAAGDAGIVFVAAAGNNGLNDDTLPYYPASFPAANIVAVGSSTPSDTRSSFSNYGVKSVDLFAPGSSILSTFAGGYAYLNGTSMAAPYVSGTVALLTALHAEDSLETRLDRILLSVDRPSTLSGLCSTGGRLDAASALGTTGPLIGSLSPAFGPATGGTLVVIRGAGFTQVSGEAAVTFGGIAATYYHVDSGTQITATAPAHPAGTVSVRVIGPFGTTPDSSAALYTYTRDAPRTYEQTDDRIAYVGSWSTFVRTAASDGAYTRASAPGSSALISFIGEKFDWVGMKGTTTGNADVYLNGEFQTTVDLAAATATYQVPVWSTGLLPYGLHEVRIERSPDNLAGKFITLDRVEVIGELAYPQPAIASVSPEAGSTLGGTRVTITGSGFKGVTAVMFGTVPATTFTVDSNSSITATAPAQGEDTVSVRVTAAGGQTPDTAADDFTYVVPLPLTRVDVTADDPPLVRTGSWVTFVKTVALGGSYLRSRTPGSSVIIPFNGTQLDWIGMIGTTTGKADVYLDGEFQTTVDLAAATATYQVPVWSTGVLIPGHHTVRIVRNSSTPAWKYITMDAIDVGGELL